ncbi:MAG: YeeE/YedE thiosulfate transporter family protein [Terracidiphilus sp.]
MSTHSVQFEGCGATDMQAAAPKTSWLALSLGLGVAFGFVLTRAEVVSWFRIQEMFRFQSFRMFGIIGSAVATGAITSVLLRRLGVRALDGEAISVPPRPLGRGIRYAAGGTIFGLGWALTGACPGPLFSLVGSGVTVLIAAILSALAGTWLYGWLRPHLPH